MLTLKDLTVGYRGRAVLEPVSLSLSDGESLLVIGSNGAGKSTLLRTMFGLLSPVSGRVEVLGSTVAPGGIRPLARRGMRFLGQGDRAFGDLTAAEHASVLARLYGAKCNSRLAFKEAPGNIRVGAMSVGQRRVEALRLLDTASSKIFALDEPRAGLDSANSRIVKEWVERKIKNGVSIVMVEHEYKDILRVFHKVLVVWNGKVTFFDRPAHEDEIRRAVQQMI